MELGFLDIAILAAAAVAAVWGAVKGISGQLASVAWLVAALGAGYLAWGPMRELALCRGYSAWAGGAAAVVLAILAASAVWALTRKLVAAVVPQPFDALAGALAALAKLAVVIAAIAWTGVFGGCSVILDRVAEIAGFQAETSEVIR